MHCTLVILNPTPVQFHGWRPSTAPICAELVVYRPVTDLIYVCALLEVGDVRCAVDRRLDDGSCIFR